MDQKEEIRYLNKVLSKLDRAIQDINERVNVQKRDIDEAIDHLQEHKRDMAKSGKCFHLLV
ncbi:MAG: hypothetical protein R6V72_11260 [Cyclobacterium sp.]|uniref:hypothetical protein n=1 Tax=unclassified Cyclobacterium TaxID=2615055 RepID=UPI0013D4955A|nr:hypothetical protein [Cyclobacterium sp. SYSU L10401]